MRHGCAHSSMHLLHRLTAACDGGPTSGRADCAHAAAVRSLTTAHSSATCVGVQGARRQLLASKAAAPQRRAAKPVRRRSCRASCASCILRMLASRRALVWQFARFVSEHNNCLPPTKVERRSRAHGPKRPWQSAVRWRRTCRRASCHCLSRSCVNVCTPPSLTVHPVHAQLRGPQMLVHSPHPTSARADLCSWRPSWLLQHTLMAMRICVTSIPFPTSQQATIRACRHAQLSPACCSAMRSALIPRRSCHRCASGSGL